MRIYIIGFLISWALITGMVNTQFQANSAVAAYNAHHCKEDLGFSIAWGAMASILWPVTLPGVYLVTGFGQYGLSYTCKIEGSK